MSGDYLEQIEHFLGAYREDGDEELIANPIAYHWLTAGMLRAAVAELKQLRAQRKYREEMTATLAKVEATPQQPEDGGERQGSPEERS